MSLAGVKAKYGEHWEEVAPTLDGKKAPANPAASFAEPAGGAPVDPTQAETDALVADGAPLWAGLLDQLQSLVDSAESLAQLQQAITQAYGGLDTSNLVKIMAAAMALAELKGLASAAEEA